MRSRARASWCWGPLCATLLAIVSIGSGTGACGRDDDPMAFSGQRGHEAGAPAGDASPEEAAPVEGGSAAPCTPATCNGHGACAAGGKGAVCTCDEGFAPPDCATRNADFGRRLKVAEDLADPDVLRLADDRFVLSGTGPGPELTLLESSDLLTWTKTGGYDPNAKDPDADYCFVWAPDLVKDAGKLYLYFSAHRGPKGNTTCPPPAGSDVTTYRAASPNESSLDFGKPEPLFAGTTGPRTYPASGCPPQGCSRAIRIDPTLYDGRLYYVFFSGGNNIASLAMSNPTDVRLHSGPAIFPTNAFEEIINEAPELYERGGRHYLFFSAAFFNSQYATFYVMGSSTSELTRERPLMRLTTPVRRKNGTLAETHGHNSIVTRGGEAFNFFHLGVFDGAGNLIRRDTWRQRIAWNADGTAMSQNAVRIAWNALGGGNKYSLDLVLRDGSVIGPCINAGTIGEATTVTFTGICPDAGDRLVHKSEVTAFRLYASPSSNFVQVGTAAYDGYSDVADIQAKQP